MFLFVWFDNNEKTFLSSNYIFLYNIFTYHTEGYEYPFDTLSVRILCANT